MEECSCFFCADCDMYCLTASYDKYGMGDGVILQVGVKGWLGDACNG